MNTKALLFIVLSIVHLSYGKIFSRCELVKKLSATFPKDKLADWNCLVKHESSYDSGKPGKRNAKDGSYDYGIFQINDRYWCKLGSPGGDCNIDCNKFLDDDITDDIKCAQKIYNRHGFREAWYGWRDHCQGKTLPSVNDCF